MNMTTKIWRWPKNEEKSENEDDFRIENDLKKKMLYSRQSPALAYMTRVVIVFTSVVAYSCRYWRVYIVYWSV